MPPRARSADERARSVPSPKVRGELAEARFLARAMELGLVVSKPFGDNSNLGGNVGFQTSSTDEG